MYHARRMFGGGLASVWPFAAVARHYLPGFDDRFSRAVQASETLIRDLGQRDGVTIERIESGTNLFRLRVDADDPMAVRERLASRGVMVAAPQGDTFLMGVNETLNRRPVAELIDVFVQAIDG